MNAIRSVGFIQKIIQSYKRAMKPLAVKYKISPSMIAILMFLGNNPQCKHAKDIVELRGIKANLARIHELGKDGKGRLCHFTGQSERSPRKNDRINRSGNDYFFRRETASNRIFQKNIQRGF